MDILPYLNLTGTGEGTLMCTILYVKVPEGFFLLLLSFFSSSACWAFCILLGTLTKWKNRSTFILLFDLQSTTYAALSTEQNVRLVVIPNILDLAFQELCSCRPVQKMESDPLNTYSQNTQPITNLLLHAVMLLLRSLQGFMHQNNRVSPTFTLSIPHSEVCPACLGCWLKS